MQHKDSSPKDTIHRIRSILDSIGLKNSDSYLKVEKRFENCYSCSLAFRTFPFLDSYGKGTDKDFAIASAYGEFMERLQCMRWTIFSNLGSIIEKEPLINYKLISKQKLKWFIDQLDENLFPSLPEKVASAPFYNVFEKKMDFLPIDLMTNYTISNGMCAGNSPEEAISQGISEIFERNASSRLFHGKIEGFPTVSVDSPLIEELKKNGLKVTVKDCSEGIFPVVGVVIEDKKSGKIRVDFGSDPSFEVALERCLTECFQTDDHLVDYRPLGSIKVAQDFIVTHHTELLYEKLMRNIGKPSKKPFKTFKTNKEYLSFLLDKIKSIKKQIFIHDCSFLNFPAYYIYIEDLSKMLRTDIKNGDAILKILFKFPNVSFEDIKELSKLIYEDAKNHPELFFDSLTTLFSKVPVFKWTNSRIFSALVFIEIKEYEKAKMVLFSPFEEKTDEIRKKMYNDLENKNYANLNTLMTHNFPRCLSFGHCLSCAYKPKCFYQKWCSLKGLIQEKMVKVDQKKLMGYLLGITPTLVQALPTRSLTGSE